MKIISFNFLFHNSEWSICKKWTNKTQYVKMSEAFRKMMFRDKTHRKILVQGLCWNLEQIKYGKKDRTGNSFWEKKDILCYLQETPRKWCLASLRSLYKGVTTSRHLVCHDKSRMQVQGINRGKHIKTGGDFFKGGGGAILHKK